MRLLVSVRDAHEAEVAVDAGADVIDAKDPAKASLGAVQGPALEGIAAAVAGRRPLSVALGDIADDPSGAGIEALARAAARAGAAVIKLGMGVGGPVPMGIDGLRVLEAMRAESDGNATPSLVLAAYADVPADARYPYAVLEAAAQCGAAGVLLDTVRKDGRRLFDAMPPASVAAWTTAAHSAGLFVALAGSLRAEDAGVARDSGADIMGVRGAVCTDGRVGHIASDRVRALVRAVAGLPPTAARLVDFSLAIRPPTAG